MKELNELLNIDTDGNKATENKTLLKKLKQLIKKTDKNESNLQAKAEDLPYTAIAVVGSKYVELKFSLDTKEAVVSNVTQDTRDNRGRNHMASAKADNAIRSMSKKQKEIV